MSKSDTGDAPRPIRCAVCRKEIVRMLIEVGPAQPTICTECAGLSLADLSDLTEEEFSDEQVHLMRLFHGKDY